MDMASEDLRLAIKHQLKSLGVSSTIDQLLSGLQLQQPGGKPVSPRKALELLQERGIIDQLAKSITAPVPAPSTNPPGASPYLPSISTAPSTRGGRTFLHVRVLGGAAFTDYLTRDPLPGEQLCLSLECFGQRLDVAPVPACVEPAFRGEAFLELPELLASTSAASPAPGSDGKAQVHDNSHTRVVSGGGGALAGAPEVTASMQLLSVRQPLHIVVASAASSSAQLQAQQQQQQQQQEFQGYGEWQDAGQQGQFQSMRLGNHQGLHTNPHQGEHQQHQQQPEHQGHPHPHRQHQGACSEGERRVVQQSCLQRVVVGLGLGEWRTVLLRRRPVVVSIQLSSGPGTTLGLPAGASTVGVLQLQLALHPRMDVALDEPLLVLQQRSESARDAEAAAGFITRARAWWAEYVRLSMHEFKHRPVKVLARGEDGAMVPSPFFVRPLQLGRLLTTPRHAARFVALLRPRDDDAHAAAGLTGKVGGLANGVLGDESADTGDLESRAAAAAVAASTGLGAECWCTLHTLLVGKTGSQEEQSVLLCSLLLGFGLDAYVCVGRLRNGAGHMWVVTRGAFFSTTHWEPSNGTHYSSLQGPALCPYLSVGSMFNHHSVWANCQADDAAATTSYVLEEPHLWRELRVGAYDRPGSTWSTLPLRAPRVNALTLEVWLEDRVKASIANHCTELWGRPQLHALSAGTNRDVVWDSTLEHLLMPALEAYEHEALTGEVAPGNEEFQSAIKQAVPLGWVFKGVPLHHRSLSPDDIVAALLADTQVQEILGAQAPGMTMALRVHVFAYPEDLFSVWLMLAAKYKGNA